MTEELQEENKKLSPAVMFSLIVAISTILASGALTMWAIIAQPPGDTVGKSFITIFLAAIFAFCLIGETRADREKSYVTIGRITALLLIAISGLYLTWNQVESEPWVDFFVGDIWAFMGVILMLEGIAASVVLLWPRMVKNMKIMLVRATFDVGIALVLLTTVLVSVAWTAWDYEWPELYWRWVLAIGVLALVFFTIPLVISMILAPKKQKQPYQQVPQNPHSHEQYQVPQQAPYGYPQQAQQDWAKIVEDSKNNPPQQ